MKEYESGTRKRIIAIHLGVGVLSISKYPVRGVLKPEGDKPVNAFPRSLAVYIYQKGRGEN